MKAIARQANKRAAFTIVELLTVMSIIVILIGLLVPALNRVRIFAREVKQKAQFHSMEAAIELFNNEFDGYPPSDMTSDPSGDFSCGATKLCEAMMGWDLLGFHTDSVFRADGTAPDPVTGNDRFLYDPTDLASRKGPFLPLENASANKLGDIYGNGKVAPFLADSRVLCDVFTRRLDSGEKLGMPILYYKANPTNALHLYDVAGTQYMPPDETNNLGNIYNYWDNNALVGLGKPWEASGAPHKLFEDPQANPPEGPGLRFYINTRNEAIKSPWRPYKAETYILISAGYDGEYGTADDLCNYEWKYSETEPPR